MKSIFLSILILVTCVVSGQNSEKSISSVLLITSEELKDAWEPFSKWKTSIGKATEILTVKEIDSRYKGKDIQEKIRLCILDYAESKGTKWVILGGDSEANGKGHVPDRDTKHIVMGRMKYGNIPTDLYYISDKSWDDNGDGVYGEWAKDKDAISYSNKWGTCIGRIPMKTVADVVAYTEKIIAYETNYPTKNFAQKIVYTNTVNASQPKVIKSWDNYLSKKWSGSEAIRFFHTKTPWDKNKPGDYPLSPANWQKLINGKTAGKMHMHGHGFLPAWVLEGHKMVGAKTINGLSNKNAYLVMTTVSCFTGQFDGPKDPSITESLLRTPQKGAVIVIAPAREGVPIFHKSSDYRLMVTEGKLDGTTESMTRFWTNGLSPKKDGSYRTAGEAFYQMKQEMAVHAVKTSGYHWCQSELNFLGDPTLDLRANNPVTPKVIFTEQIKVKKKSTIVVKTGVPLATICLSKEGEIYRVIKADKEGVVKAEIMAQTTGKVKLSVNGASINIFQGIIEVK
jgi:hypothetical protein